AMPEALRAQAADVAGAVRTGGSDAPPTDPNLGAIDPGELPFDPGSLDDGGVFDSGLPSDDLGPVDGVAPGEDPATQPGGGPGSGGGDTEESAAKLPISSFHGGDG